MDKLNLLRELFDQKVIDIISNFISNPNKQFYLKEVSDDVHVPIATTHRILKKLAKNEIIIETNISKFKVYQLAQNEKTEYLNSFIEESVKVLEIFIKQASTINSVKQIIMHGKESKTRANVLLIGQEIDSNSVKNLASHIKERYDYTISYMTLTIEQYEQMSSMGLYSGTKKVLFER